MWLQGEQDPLQLRLFLLVRSLYMPGLWRNLLKGNSGVRSQGSCCSVSQPRGRNLFSGLVPMLDVLGLTMASKIPAWMHPRLPLCPGEQLGQEGHKNRDEKACPHAPVGFCSWALRGSASWSCIQSFLAPPTGAASLCDSETPL